MVREYSRRPVLRARRSIGSRRPGISARVFAAMAMLALATPSLSAVNPAFAGWLPSHGHIYEAGIPVPHAHPWDASASAAQTLSAGDASDEAAGAVAFTWDLSSTVQSLTVPAAVGVVLGAMWLLLLASVQLLGLPSTALTVPTPPPR